MLVTLTSEAAECPVNLDSILLKPELSDVQISVTSEKVCSHWFGVCTVRRFWCSLVVQDTKLFHAHKLVLAVGSEVFKTMFFRQRASAESRSYHRLDTSRLRSFPSVSIWHRFPWSGFLPLSWTSVKHPVSRVQWKWSRANFISLYFDVFCTSEKQWSLPGTDLLVDLFCYRERGGENFYWRKCPPVL